MSRENRIYQIDRDPESFDTPGRLAKLVRFVGTRLGWIILPLILFVYLLTRETKAKQEPVFALIALYLVYEAMVEFLQWRKRPFYRTRTFRFVRIQIRALMTSLLVYLTGGAESPFWFLYLWPLTTAALYLTTIEVGVVCLEVFSFYFAASLFYVCDFVHLLVSPSCLAGPDWTILVSNTIALFAVTGGAHYLLVSMRRSDAAERPIPDILRDSAAVLPDLDRSVTVLVNGIAQIVWGVSCALWLHDQTGNEIPEGPFETLFTSDQLADRIARNPHSIEVCRYLARQKDPKPEYVERIEIGRIRSALIRAFQEILPRSTPSWLRPFEEGSSEWLELREETKWILKPESVKAAAYIPMISGRTLIAVLCVYLTDFDHFYTVDKGVLELFAAQAGSAIENARLHQERERRIKQLEALTEIGQTLTTLTTEELLTLIYGKMTEIMEISDAQVQFAFLEESDGTLTFPLTVETQGGEITDLVWWGKREAEYSETGQPEDVRNFQPRHCGERLGLHEYIIRHKQPVMIRENFGEWVREHGVTVWPTFGRFERPTQAFLGVPMLVERDEVKEAAEESERWEQLVTDSEMKTSGKASAAEFNAPEEATRIFRVAKRLAHYYHYKLRQPTAQPDIDNSGATRPVNVGHRSTSTANLYSPSHRRRVIGVLSVHSLAQEYTFDEDQLHILSAIATQAAVAIQNVRFREEMEALVKKRTDSWEQERKKAMEAEKAALMGAVSAEFAHRMTNLAGTIPIRINKAKAILEEHNLITVTAELDGVLNDARRLLLAAKEIQKSSEMKAREAVDIRDLLETAIGIVRNTHPDIEGKVSIKTEISNDLPKIVADRVKLLDTFVSVISNGVEAMPGGGDLTISARSSLYQGRLCVEVKIADTGVGMLSSDILKIFDLFFTTKQGHLGFGLWRDRVFVKQMGGDIEVESSPGVGSTFTLRLPS